MQWKTPKPELKEPATSKTIYRSSCKLSHRCKSSLACLWKQNSQLHKIQHKTMVDSAWEKWQLKSKAWMEHHVHWAHTKLNCSMSMFPNVVVLSSLSFLPITQPPIRRPNSGPPIGFSGSRVGGWTIFLLVWMNVEHKEDAMRNGLEMLTLPCLGVTGWMMYV